MLGHKQISSPIFAPATSRTAHNGLSYLHDDEDDQRDEDVELRVFPGLGVADVVKLLGDALFSPGPVVQQSHQRLLLGELQGTGSDIILKNILHDFALLPLSKNCLISWIIELLEGEWNRHGLRFTHSLAQIVVSFSSKWLGEHCVFHCVCLFIVWKLLHIVQYKLEKQF